MLHILQASSNKKDANQMKKLPLWGKRYTLNLLSDSITVYRHQADQS